MATNRFYGALITPEDRDSAEYFGILAGKLNTLKVEGRLSEQGSASDFDFAEDYSGTSAWCAYKATAESVIYRMVLHLNLSTFTGSTANDETLFMGGATALTNGVIWGVSSVLTNTSPDLYASSAAKNLSQFASVWGAEIFRYSYSVDATASENSDDFTVMLDFEDLYGMPIKLQKNRSIGIYLNDNLSASGLSFTGKVFGRVTFD